jgi:hypothetical protein
MNRLRLGSPVRASWVARQGHHPGRRHPPAQLGDHGRAVAAGHAEVEHDHVRLGVGGQPEGLVTVGGLSDQLEAPSLEGRPEQRSQLREVVGDQDADGCGQMHGGDMVTLRGTRTNRPDEYSCLSPGWGPAASAGNLEEVPSDYCLEGGPGARIATFVRCKKL